MKEYRFWSKLTSCFCKTPHALLLPHTTPSTPQLKTSALNSPQSSFRFQEVLVLGWNVYAKLSLLVFLAPPPQFLVSTVLVLFVVCSPSWKVLNMTDEMILSVHICFNSVLVIWNFIIQSFTVNQTDNPLSASQRPVSFNYCQMSLTCVLRHETVSCLAQLSAGKSSVSLQQQLLQTTLLKLYVIGSFFLWLLVRKNIAYYFLKDIRHIDTTFSKLLLNILVEMLGEATGWAHSSSFYSRLSLHFFLSVHISVHVDRQLASNGHQSTCCHTMVWIWQQQW